MFAPAAFNQNGREYLTHANDQVVIIVQIESGTAVENCEAIASVRGIGRVPGQSFSPEVPNKISDALFVGPNDLACSMGYFAFDHATIPEVVLASKRVLRAAKDAGKYAGHFALTATAGTNSLLIANTTLIHWFQVRKNMLRDLTLSIAELILLPSPHGCRMRWLPYASSLLPRTRTTRSPMKSNEGNMPRLLVRRV